MKYRSCMAIIILSGLLRVPAFPLPEEPVFSTLSSREGLSQNTVSCLLQDSRGFMWFGTDDGLNRYDGKNFVHYRHVPDDPNSLSDSYIISLCEDRRGSLWVGTFTGGINRFDPDTGGFIRLSHDPDRRGSLSHNQVRAILEDRMGQLWIGTQDGLNRYDPGSGRFEVFRHLPGDAGSLSDSQILTLLESRSGGDLWIGTPNGLSRLDRRNGAFRRYAPASAEGSTGEERIVRGLCESADGHLWVGTDGGLFLLDPTSGRYKKALPDPIRSIHEDQDGNLWLAVYGSGLARYDPDSGRLQRFCNRPLDSGSLANDFALSVYEDATGLIWVGTFGGGVSRFERMGRKFRHYRSEPHSLDSLNNNTVFSIFEDRRGAVWVGTYGGGINLLDPDSGGFRFFRHDPRRPGSLSSDNVRVLLEDSHGIIWAGTYGGLNRFHREKETFTVYRHDPKDAASLSNNYVRSLLEDRRGRLWIGTIDGLNRFDRSTETFVCYRTLEEDPTSLPQNSIYSLFEDRRGILWIGTGGGLSRFDEASGTFRSYRHIPGRPHGLSNDLVFVIQQDRSGIFWIGTYGGGLNRFDPESGRFRCYREKDGLPNDVVYAVMEDELGRLWLSTNRGLSRFDPRTESFRNFDIEDGLQSQEFNSGAYHRNRKGEMFFGGTNGFNRFHPALIQDDPHSPRLAFTDFQVFNRSVNPGPQSDGRTILEKTITCSEIVRLKHTDRVINFEFAALHFAASEKNQYAYRLDPLDKDWIQSGNRSSATFAYLPPGRYTFRVKASNHDGVWNREGIAMRVFISPPFWVTWWFRAGVLVGCGFLLLISHLARTSGIRRRNRRLQEINLRMEREIEDRRKAERALQAARDQLESRVDERTVELRAANRELKHENFERRQVESALKESERFLQEVFDGIQDGICVLDSRLNIIRANLWMENKYLNQAPLAGKKCYTAFQNRAEPCPWCPSLPAMKSGRVHSRAVPFPQDGGPPGWIDLSSFPLKDPQGRVVGVIEHVKDVTEQKQADDRIKDSLKEKEVLLKEIHHRVKNNMQIISSLIRLQSLKIEDDRSLDVFRESQSRIRSMALIHEGLYQSQDFAHIDFSDYLDKLTRHLSQVFGGCSDRIRIEMEVKDVILDINRAIPCGLIISELVTNSMKHAFPEGRLGRICIHMRPANGGYHLSVNDDGIGLPPSFDLGRTNTLGMQLIMDLIRQLDGKIEFGNGRGTRIAIHF